MFKGYDSEEDYFDSLKQNDHYHFSISFEYIEKDNGDDNYDIANAVMEVDVDWDGSEHGYKISYHCPDMYKIDPAEGNGTIEDFYDSAVAPIILDKLKSMGITYEALVGGIGM